MIYLFFAKRLPGKNVCGSVGNHRRKSFKSSAAPASRWKLKAKAGRGGGEKEEPRDHGLLRKIKAKNVWKKIVVLVAVRKSSSFYFFASRKSEKNTNCPQGKARMKNLLPSVCILGAGRFSPGVQIRWRFTSDIVTT